MTTRKYTASKNLPKGRSSWVINFRHPLRIDPRTEQGLKVRRGLSTSDEWQAQQLVDEMNELLGNDSFHNIAMKAEAAHRFSSVIVNAFYDGIDNTNSDTQVLREAHIPLPTAEDGYAKVLFVGTTGAGKTSLLRHLIASDPEKDRFPSTSTAKTTIADLEIITGSSGYRGVVTFFSEWSVRTSIRECIADACLAVYEGTEESKVATRLLNHQDQKFRLSYILGSWNPSKKTLEAAEEEDDWDDVSTPSIEISDNDLPTAEEQSQMQVTLESYLQRVKTIAGSAANQIRSDVGEDVTTLSEDARAAAEERFDQAVQAHEDFDELLNDIIDEIQKRFERLSSSALRRRSNGWPEVWTCESDDRDSFINQIRQFSSNYAGVFGRLLTPLVQGIRVQGAFQPLFSEHAHKLVLIDGQGLGHTPDSASSVTTHITKRFDDIDTILLVDNAQQPIQAAPLSVIRAVAASGHHRKLAIAFTHFDSVKGANLPNFEAKKAHVLASVTNGLRSLSAILGQPVVRALERNLETKCFMIGGLNRSLEKAIEGQKRRQNREEMLGLLDFCQRSTETQSEVEIAPRYDPDGLAFAVQAATHDFQKRWDAILGLNQLAGIHKEHWTRVKALNRRLAEKTDVEYDTLRPVADFLARLNEAISHYLNEPENWTKKPNSEDEAEVAIDMIRQKIFTELHPLSEKRIATNPISRWIASYQYVGTGSTFKRAGDIHNIYVNAAPELNLTMNPSAKEFLNEIKAIVFDAVESVGGKFERGLPADCL